MSVEENFVDGGHAPGPDGLMDGAEEDNVVHSRYGEDGPPQEHTTEDQLAAEVLGSLAHNQCRIVLLWNQAFMSLLRGCFRIRRIFHQF